MTKLKTKNFIRGVGSVLDIYPSKGKYSIKRTQRPKNDFEALNRDWRLVGETLSKVMGKHLNG
jgi:hypothetical protein